MKFVFSLLALAALGSCVDAKHLCGITYCRADQTPSVWSKKHGMYHQKSKFMPHPTHVDVPNPPKIHKHKHKSKHYKHIWNNPHKWQGGGPGWRVPLQSRGVEDVEDVQDTE